MLFSIICLSRKFSVSCKRLFETRYFSATDWKQTVAFSLPTILYKNVTTRWIRSLHHFNPTPCKVRPSFCFAAAMPSGRSAESPQGSCIIPADFPQDARIPRKPLCRRCFPCRRCRWCFWCCRACAISPPPADFAGTGRFSGGQWKKRGMVVVFNNIYYLYAQVVRW